MHCLLYPAISGYLCRSSSGPYNISRQISLQLSFFAKMNAGGKNVSGHSGRELGSSPSGNSANPHDPNHSSNGRDRSSYSARVAGGSSKRPESCYVSKPTYTYDEEEFPPLSATINSGSKSRRLNKSTTPIEQKSEYFIPLQIGSLPIQNPIVNLEDTTPIEQKSKYFIPLQIESFPIQNPNMNLEDDFSLPTSFGKKSIPSRGRGKTRFHSSPNYAVDIENTESLEEEFSLPSRLRNKGIVSLRRRKERVNFYSNNTVGTGNSDCSESLPKIEPFDICHSVSRKFGRRKPSLDAQNQQSWSEQDNSVEGVTRVLRPGMILLKSYITHSEQVKIVRKCRELGLGTGGFYQPSFRGGAKLRLQLMCLGLNWNPETRKYENRRPVDWSEPPAIPYEFSLLVERAIQDSHDLIKKDPRVGNVEDILPRMSPNICIVNFYTTSGRLGLHQDRDESKKSLEEGLPVVSFSVGNSAEFLYGDQRDVNKAENVILESGDVLIFGGEARHIFHGVPSIIPDSAPVALLEETNIRPGRLNLTFRQF